MSPAAEGPPLFARLRDDLGHRRIAQGLQTLERIRPEIECISAHRVQSGILLGLVAQWVDAGFDSPELLVRLLSRFPPDSRVKLPVIEYLHLRMAESVIEMAHENHRNAIDRLRIVLGFEAELPDRELLAIANFWTGRCHRNLGQYEEALPFVLRAEELAQSCGYSAMAAITQVTRSWLSFQKGRLDDAVAILRSAEEALQDTDDFLNRGNIHSSRGRIARRQGRLETAIECFENAIAEYRKGHSGHLQIARALQNLAFAKRSRALQSQKELDLATASRRSGAAPGGEIAMTRSFVESTRAAAGAHIEESIGIYERYGNHRGIAGGHIVRGFLRLDAGDFESAVADAAEAFRHGNEKSDHFVMARARLLQCVIENAALDEQLGDPVRHHEAAAGFARDAVDFAGRTQNRRLLARAHVWQGLTFGAGNIPDLEAARRCCEQATALLQPETAGRQPAWEELELLKAAVLRAAPIDPKLRAWSAGAVEDISFQQLTEEFARLVIPKVWEREGRKISRVAARLSISPRKVRRILQSVGELKA